MVILDIILGAIIQCIVVAVIAGTIACVFVVLKSEATYRAHNTICHAIYKYQMNRLENTNLIGTPIFDEVDYTDMESYEKTFNRLYDWGYTRILPKDKFEIIKPFIGKE